MHPGSLRERWTCSRLNFPIAARLSSRAVTLPVTTIIVSSFLMLAVPSRNRIGGARKIYRLLRPTFQCGMSGIGQHINAPFGAIEPAINVVLQDFRGVGNLGLEIAHTPWPPRQRRRAGQRLLAIGRHDRRARAASERRIAP